MKAKHWEYYKQGVYLSSSHSEIMLAKDGKSAPPKTPTNTGHSVHPDPVQRELMAQSHLNKNRTATSLQLGKIKLRIPRDCTEFFAHLGTDCR